MRGPIPRFHTHLITAAAGVIAAAILLVVFLDGSRGLPPLNSGYQVQALVPSSSALAEDSRVTEAGVDVGHVESVRRDGASALVRFALDGAHSPIPVDSRVGITLDTLIGEKSLALTPGLSGRMLPSGGVLSLRAADPFVDVDRILSVLHGDTRRRAQQALEGLGGALDRRGADVNALLQGVGQMIVNGAPVVRTLAADRAPLAALVANLAGIAQQIGSRGQALAGLSSDLVTTFRALASRDQAVRAIIGQLPATLAQVQATSGVLERTTGLAAPVISRLASALRALSPAVHLLRPAADEAGAVVGELGGAAPRLRSTFAALERIAPPLVSALPKLRAVLCQADPPLRYLEPYARDLASMIEGVGAAVNEYDANGHTARLAIAVGPSSLYGGMSPSAAAALQTLRRSGLVSQITQLGYDPYPPPGDANNTTIGRNTVGPRDDSQPYPHVLADC